jgi:hypothetical protein
MKNHKTAIFIALLIGGIILISVGGLLKGAELKSIAGVCIGAGAGVFGVSLAQLLLLRISKKDPAYERKIAIEDKDERNITIRNRAKAKAFDAMGVILGITMLIYALISADLLVILLIVVSYIIIYAVQIYYLSKYAKQM